MPSGSFQNIVLPTKLHRPRTHGNAVLRPRLLAQLDAGLQHRVTLMAELLQASVHRHPQNPYRRHLVQACGGAHPSGSGTMALGDPSPGAAMVGGPAEAMPCELLTQRELDVVRMLQERLSNKEIAARLFVSAETVKRHTRNLYRKLHVHGRRQAVATARQHGLLSSDSPALSPPSPVVSG